MDNSDTPVRSARIEIWLDRDVQHDKSDKDPDLRKSSDVEEDLALLPPKPKWSQTKWARLVGTLICVVLGVGVIVLAGGAANFMFNGMSGDANSSSAAGAWASAVGATALALASVWLAWRSEQHARDQAIKAEEAAKQARIDALQNRSQDGTHHRQQMRAAEKRHQDELARIEKEIRERQAADEREREYQATEAILQASARYAAEVHNLIRSIQTSLEITDILRRSTLTDADKTAHQFMSMYVTEFQQQNLLRIFNESLTAVRLALYQIKNKSMRHAATQIMATMIQAANQFTNPTRTNDWEAAADAADAVLAAHAELQRVAIHRFEHADDNIPSPEAPPRTSASS